MASFPNTLGLLAANTVINGDTTLPAAPVIRAVVRDLKKYMSMRHRLTGQRVLPIGYNAATTSARDQTILEYLSLGDQAIDFWTVGGVIEA